MNLSTKNPSSMTDFSMSMDSLINSLQNIRLEAESANDQKRGDLLDLIDSMQKLDVKSQPQRRKLHLEYDPSSEELSAVQCQFLQLPETGDLPLDMDPTPETAYEMAKTANRVISGASQPYDLVREIFLRNLDPQHSFRKEFIQTRYLFESLLDRPISHRNEQETAYFDAVKEAHETPYMFEARETYIDLWMAFGDFYPLLTSHDISALNAQRSRYESLLEKAITLEFDLTRKALFDATYATDVDAMDCDSTLTNQIAASIEHHDMRTIETIYQKYMRYVRLCGAYGGPDNATLAATEPAKISARDIIAAIKQDADTFQGATDQDGDMNMNMTTADDRTTRATSEQPRKLKRPLTRATRAQSRPAPEVRQVDLPKEPGFYPAVQQPPSMPSSAVLNKSGGYQKFVPVLEVADDGEVADAEVVEKVVEKVVPRGEGKGALAHLSVAERERYKRRNFS
ncbi:hypothetical protein K402DRAFT_397373 [Aulographum hederae CBS 113979]|uniref:Uncharacterized protein n=1 Tax=Aulographum hederae CBS 113979 TaxID=1176131 RepID=A0A6G1GP95_9PEZI|nr:hypothetical protein K402DRAFT_397373 [Aulographum hederae CBS 113979]